MFCSIRQIIVHSNLKKITVTNEASITEKKNVTIHFRTYGDDKFEGAKQRIINEATLTGWFNGTVLALGVADLPTDFRTQFDNILSMRRGGGYWIWKPKIIKMAFDMMDVGDFLVYLDSGCKINDRASTRFFEYLSLIMASPYDMISFEQPYIEHVYTTERIFQHFNISETNYAIRNTSQHLGGILVIRKGPHSLRWLSMMENAIEADPLLITDTYNKETSQFNPSFRDNRHDQSISSVVRKLIGSVLLVDETYPPGQTDVPFWAARCRSSSCYV
jgi:hypothetical protein